jgi:hypothetical protein
MNEFEKRIQAQIERRPSPNRTVEKHLIKDLIRAILWIDEETDAKAFFEGYVAYINKTKPIGEALKVARNNIGWCFGEGMTPEQVLMWRRTCEAAHPMLRYDEDGNPPSPEESFQTGIEWGEKIKREESN